METLNSLSLFQTGHEMTGVSKGEGVAGLVAAVLLWVSGFFAASRSEVAAPVSHSYFENYCSHCGCVLDSVNVAPQGYFDSCMECSEKQ